MAWRRERPPFDVAPRVRAAGFEDFIDGEALGALVGVLVEQRSLVPRVDQRRLAGRYGDGAAVRAPQRGVPADMIGVTMRVDELRERPAVEAPPRSDQREHQRHVL